MKEPAPWHVIRMYPRREADVLAGGSIYWVIDGYFAVRQRITGLDRITVDDGTQKCRIALDRALIPVQPWPRRPFQGWRYLEPDDAPPDSGDVRDDSQRLHRELSELGLL